MADEKEKLNDLMNKISFALEDATLAQGFEIICKRIAELKIENEKIKWQLKEVSIIKDELEVAEK